MGQFIEDLQYKIKTSSGNMLLVAAKVLVGLVLGLTFAIIGQQMVGYATFSFLLVIVATTMSFYRVARAWKWSYVGIFALTCVLVALLLRMYILVAPGA